ncbi:MAG: DUF460 domain-containing protein, partial [Candidatus Micrarchaeota archaeon]|nr:DUF460 domain-containing protein [Candidatus Micrarchaeota archaeon]
IATQSANKGIGEAVAIIEKYGTPSMIACDKMPAPEMVQKAASYFSCRLFTPSRNIREEEKREIAHGANVSNNHERDAYSAGVLAYRQYANKLRQIDALADLQEEEKEKIKHMLLKGYRLVDAFASLGGHEPEEQGERETKTVSREHVLSVEDLRSRVSSIARENANLHLLIEKLEAEKRQLSSRLIMLQNDMRRSILQDSELRRLKYQLQQSLDHFTHKKKKGPQQQQQKTGQPQTQKKGQQEQQGQQKKPQQVQQQQKSQPVQQQTAKKHDVKNEKEDTLNNMTESRIDIEKLVAEYRKGRK